MSTLIGNKNNFAIEYSIVQLLPHLMGNIRLWIGGYYVGYYDSPIILGTAASELDTIRQSYGEMTIENIKNIDPKDIEKSIYSDESDEINQNMRSLMLADSTDDFLLYLYEDGDQLVFFWKLLEDHDLDYPNYDYELHTFPVSKYVYDKIVKEFSVKIKMLR